MFNLKVDSAALGVDRPRGSSESNATSPSAVSHLSFIKGNGPVILLSLVTRF